MKQQNTTKTRKMLVRLMDQKGKVFEKIFSIEIPVEFDNNNWKVDTVEIAHAFHKPYPGSVSKLAQNLITSQIYELEKAKILASTTLDKEVKVRFISDYNLATSNRLTALRNLYPKVRAYRAEKVLAPVALERFAMDFYPIDAEGKRWSPFQYVTIEKDDTVAMNTVKIKDMDMEAVEGSID